MEKNTNKKNNIQEVALNVGAEKASSKYYPYQNDYNDEYEEERGKAR